MFKWRKKSFPLEYKTFYATRPDKKQIVQILYRCIDGVLIINDSTENVIFEFNGKMYETLIKDFEGAYYIAIREA